MVSYKVKLIILSSSLVVFSLLVIGPLYIIKQLGEDMLEDGKGSEVIFDKFFLQILELLDRI